LKKDIFKISSSISFTNQLINSNFVLYLNRFSGTEYAKDRRSISIHSKREFDSNSVYFRL